MAALLRSGKYLRCFAGFTRNVVNTNSAREGENKPALIQNVHSMCQATKKFSSNAAAVSVVRLDRSVQRLEHDSRRMGRLSREDIENVLNEIRTTRKISSSQSLMVIRSCGDIVSEELPEARMALVNEVWSTLKTLQIPLDISHYNALLRVYFENEHAFSPSEILAEIEEQGLQPNRVTYQWLIRGFCQQGDINGATRILEHMRSKQMPVNEHVFNSLILGHSEAKDMESAKNILTVMKQAGLEPSAETYLTLICAYARHGDIEALRQTIEECEKMELIFGDKDILEIVYALAIHGHKDVIDEVLSKLIIGNGFNQSAINVILRLVNKGQEDIGLRILRLMPRPKRTNGEPIDAGMFFIKQLVKTNTPIEKVLSICKTLQEEGLNSRALQIATGAGLYNASVSKSLPLLKEMKNAGYPIRQHYFWPVIASAKSNQVLDIVRRMQTDFELSPTFETVRDYVIPNMKVNNYERTLIALRNSGIPNSTAVASAVYAALQAHKIADAAEIMEANRIYFSPGIFRQALLSAISINRDYSAFVRCVRQIYENLSLGGQRADKEADSENTNANTNNDDIAAQTEIFKSAQTDFLDQILHSTVLYVKQDAAAILEKILPLLVEQGISISENCARRITAHLGGKLTPLITENLNKLSSGELEPSPLPNASGKKRPLDTLSLGELERFIKNVEAKGENANNLKRHLIGTCLRSHNLEKSVEVVNRLESENFIIPTGVYAQLIDLFVMENRSDEALAQYKKLRAANLEFQLDNLKTLRLFQQLLSEDRSDEAFQILEENKKPYPMAEGTGSSNYDSLIWRILNSIAETGNVTKLQNTFDALIKSNYVLPNNVLLGPLVKVHLVNDNIAKAMDEFENICLKYRATPWKHELSCRLIQAEDATNLQRLTDLSTTIHGEVNSLYDLVFAFLECGRFRQARKILETAGLRTRTYRITQACERYCNDNKIEPLEALIEATKGLSYIDRAEIYYSLLTCYNKENHAEKALGLWTKMQEEDVIPSDQFLAKLAQLLERNSLDVPFAVPAAAAAAEVDESELQLDDSAAAAAATEEKGEKSPQSEHTQFRQSLTKGDVNSALFYKDNLTAQGKLKVNDLSHLMELLLQQNRITEAKECYEDLESKEQFPRQSVFKFLLNKLALAGEVEYIERIGGRINDDYKKLLSYDNRLCNAAVAAGKTQEFLQKLTDEIAAANTPEEVKKLAQKFPRGGALGILENQPEVLPRYKILAEEFAKKNALGPVNVLWQYYLTNDNEQDAKNLWDRYLSSAPRLMFQRVMQTAREQQNEKIVKTIISQLRTSKVSEGAIGIAYSCLIDIQTKKGDLDVAMDTLATGLKDISLENINSTALQRLKQQITATGKAFPYTIPEKSSKSSSSSSSDDDDVVPQPPENVEKQGRE